MTLELRCEDLRDDFDEVVSTFRTVLLNLGFSDEAITIGDFASCRITTALDDFDQQERMLADWVDENGARYAHLVRYADGNLFAEHDVLQPHPQNEALFVEAIEIWGQAGTLKGEARLLPAL